MIKKYTSERTRHRLFFIQIALFIGMISVLTALLVGPVIVSDAHGRHFQLDIYDETERLETSEMVQFLFGQDIQSNIYYLSICQQLERDGNFDKNRTIDLLQYVNRRDDRAEELTSSGELTYRIGDLINWYSVDFFELTTEQTPESAIGEVSYFDVLTEVYLPTDGISIKNKDLYKILRQAGIIDMDGHELTQLDFQSYVEDYGYLYKSTVTDEAEIFGEDSYQEFYAVESEDVLQEKIQEYLRLRAENLVSQYIMSAAEDLANNYESYLAQQSYFQKNVNFKYLYVPQRVENAAYYTNCNIPEGKSVSDLQKMFEAQLAAETGICVQYDFNEDEIRTNNYDSADKNHTKVRIMMRDYEYSFRDKGILYMAYVPTAGLESFGASPGQTVSDYMQAEKVFYGLKPYAKVLTVVFCLCFVLWMICFFLWNCMLGYKKEIMEDGTAQLVKLKAQELRGFDRWYTGIAAAFAIALIGGILYGVSHVFTQFYLMDTVTGPHVERETMLFVLLATGTVWAILFHLFWASLIRRVKTHTFWRNSVVCRFFGWIDKRRKQSAVRFSDGMDGKHEFVRIWLPYLIFLMCNLFFIRLGSNTGNAFGGILIAFILDLVVGGFLVKRSREKGMILNGIRRITEGEIAYQIDVKNLHGENLILAEAVNQIGDGIHEAVEISMKDERLKADLITNVSHDIKTPLTSIINYVDLLKKANIGDEKAQEYIQVLDEKSQRLKQLTLDLLEVSKISSGNIVLHMEDIRIKDLMLQVFGEYSDKFAEKDLDLVASFPEKAVVISADSRRMWRVMENLFNNILKYAMEGSRVYLDVELKDKLWITIKNISSQPLNINADELTERFIRGDVSRSTEGSGLGLSIAKSLVEAQKGCFQIFLDGDLFKVVIGFEEKKLEEQEIEVM